MVPRPTGPLPPEIASLTGLRELHLQCNAFVGGVPAGWTALQQLRVLDLSSNTGISGSLHSLLTSLPGLRHLDVSYTGITGPLTAAALSTMSALAFLALDGTRMDCPLPAVLPASLVHLSAESAGLTGGLEVVQWSRLTALACLGAGCFTGCFTGCWVLVVWSPGRLGAGCFTGCFTGRLGRRRLWGG
jgi:hypothetical protein